MEKMIAAKATFKSFKMHYEDAEYFLSMAKKNKKQKNRRVEWRYSRTSILSYYFGIEALINFILYDMHSNKIFSTLTLENLEKMRLPDKYLIEGWSLLYSICYVFYMRYRSSVHKIEKEQKLVGEYRKQKKGLDVSFPLHPDRFQREQAFNNIKHRLHSDLS